MDTITVHPRDATPAAVSGGGERLRRESAALAAWRQAMGERTVVLRKGGHWFVLPAPTDNPAQMGQALLSLLTLVEKRPLPAGDVDAAALASDWGWELVEFRQAANGLSSLAGHAA